jgi:hypothetical protein
MIMVTMQSLSDDDHVPETPPNKDDDHVQETPCKEDDHGQKFNLMEMVMPHDRNKHLEENMQMII